MKKILFSSAAILALWMSYSSTQFTHSSPGGAPAARTGAPRATTGVESTCATSGCHGSNLNSGTNGAQIVIPMDTAGFVSGQSYSVTAKLTNATGTAGGFQIVAINPSRGNAGSWTTSAGNQTVSSGGRSYVTHTNRNNRSWTFSWNAPPVAPDSVTFYLACMEANGNTFNTYTTKKVFRKKVLTSSGDQIQAATGLSVFPTHASGFVQVRTGVSSPGDVQILSVDGKEYFRSLLPFGQGDERIELASGIPGGMYWLRVYQDGAWKVRRFVKE
jgi:hypothetical protein